MEMRERIVVASFSADCREGSSKDEKLQLTQKALAERMNCIQQYVSKILKRQREPFARHNNKA